MRWHVSTWTAKSLRTSRILSVEIPCGKGKSWKYHEPPYNFIGGPLHWWYDLLGLSIKWIIMVFASLTLFVFIRWFMEQMMDVTIRTKEIMVRIKKGIRLYQQLQVFPIKLHFEPVSVEIWSSLFLCQILQISPMRSWLSFWYVEFFKFSTFTIWNTHGQRRNSNATRRITFEILQTLEILQILSTKTFWISVEENALVSGADLGSFSFGVGGAH